MGMPETTMCLIDKKKDGTLDLTLQISSICEEVIINPEKIYKIGKLLNVTNNSDPTVILSLLKVFLHTAPLYKIKIINDNVKHKQEYLKLEKYDRSYLEVFGKFVHKVVKGCEYVNYKCSSNILENLSHFNYIEKIIVHVLEGTRNNNKAIVNMCLAALERAFKEDFEGFLVSKIVQQMNVFGFGPATLELLLDIPFIDAFIGERKYKTKLQFIKEERLKKYRKIKEETVTYKINKKINLDVSRSAKKDDKISKKKIVKSMNEDGIITFEQKEKNFQQIINALHRVYLFILRDKMSPYYYNTFKGLLKYKVYLKEELAEGTNILLRNLINEKMKNTEKILLLRTILFLNETNFLDLGTVISSFLMCFEKAIKQIKKTKGEKYGIYSSILLVVDAFFIKQKQNTFRVNKVLKNLMLSACFFYLPEYAKRIYKIIDIYDVDLNEVEFCGDEDGFSPFYEYDLFKKMCYLK